MIQLFLDNNEIFIPTSQSIKLTRENPYIVSSGDYTMDVQAPLSIAANRAFFGPWHRVESKKLSATYAARLYADNLCVLNGSAKVTAVTQEYVKLQLYGDQSEFNAVFGDLYVDELPLPYISDLDYINGNIRSSSAGTSSGRTGQSRRTSSLSTRTTSSAGYTGTKDRRALSYKDEAPARFRFVPVYDEGADEVANRFTVVTNYSGVTTTPIYNARPQWSLFYIVQCVFESLGYSFDPGGYDASPYNIILVANCTAAREMAAALPHWTLKEFVEQVGRFYGCVFRFASGSLSVKMEPLSSAYAETQVEIEAEDDFSVEVDDDNTVESAGTSNLHYDLSDSDYHTPGYIDEETLAQMPLKEYASKTEMVAAYNSMSKPNKAKTLFHCPEGYYCQWLTTDAEDASSTTTELRHVNQFADLIREETDEDGDTADNTIDLKIVPAAMVDDIKIKDQFSVNRGWTVKGQHYVVMPSMAGGENDSFASPWDHEYTADRTSALGDDDEDAVSAQELLEGGTDNDESEKPDRIEVYFCILNTQQPTTKQFGGDTLATERIPLAYTAWDIKNSKGHDREKFSLSLNYEGADVCSMYKWHQPVRIDARVKYTVKFLSDTIPEASSIFLIRNKRFLCEKIEIEISDGKVKPMKTGYFYPLN